MLEAEGWRFLRVNAIKALARLLLDLPTWWASSSADQRRAPHVVRLTDRDHHRDPHSPGAQPIKVLWASLVGTSLESYDFFYVFSYLSAFFLGPLGVFGGTLAAFLTNALGFVARSLGAIVFPSLRSGSCR